MKTDRKLLDLPPGPAARLLALAQLEHVRGAAHGLDAGESNAIHEFRVGLRRLRTTLRTFTAELEDGARGRDRKELRRLSRLLNEHRDLEAQLTLLGSFDADAATDAVRARLKEDITESGDSEEQVVKAFRKLDARLGRSLRKYRERLDPDEVPEPVVFRTVIAAQGAELANTAMVALGTVESMAETRALHAARLRVKRLRYSIEPLRAVNLAVVDATARLMRVQDLLGGMRDHAALIATVESMAADEPEQQGLHELAATARQRAAALASELEQLWLYGNCKWFFQRLINALTPTSPVAAAPTARRSRSRAAGSLSRDPSLA